MKVIGIIIIGGLLTWFSFNMISGNGLERKSNCYYKSGYAYFAPDLTEKECDEKKETHKKEKALEVEDLKKLNKKGESIGCYFSRYEKTYSNFCKSNNHIYYVLEKEGELIWHETPESKLCAKYKDSKMSDLPVECLSYWQRGN